MLSAGRLRHRIEIQKHVVTTDSHGDTQPRWETFATCWAAINPISAREFEASQAMQSKSVVRIVIRYRSGVQPAMRILHKGRIYNIEGVLADRDSGLEYLTLPCSEGVNDGT